MSRTPASLDELFDHVRSEDAMETSELRAIVSGSSASAIAIGSKLGWSIWSVGSLIVAAVGTILLVSFLIVPQSDQTGDETRRTSTSREQRRRTLPPIDTSAEGVDTRPRGDLPWGYRFTKGERFLLTRTYDHRDTAWGDEGMHIAVADITVESVDAEGNATLLVEVTEDHDGVDGGPASPGGVTVGKPPGPTLTTISVSYEIPKSRVVISRYGIFISGEILVDAPYRQQLMRELSDTSAAAITRWNRRELERIVEQWFMQMPPHNSIRVGNRWIDTVDDVETPERIPPPGTHSDRGQKKSESHHGVPRLATQTIRQYNPQGVTRHEGDDCLRVVVIYTRIFSLEQERMNVTNGLEEQYVRLRDGFPVYQHKIYDGHPRPPQKGTHWNEVVELTK